MARDSDDFSAFVASRSTALLRTATLLCGGDRPLGEDLLQETFVHAYRSWGRIRDHGARDAYVRRILVRTATGRWRRRRTTHEQVSDRTPEGLVEGHEAGVAGHVDVWRALAALSAQQRAVVVLRYYEDLSEREIADVLGCAPGTVKSHASRALKSLEQQLGTAAAPDGDERVEREEGRHGPRDGH